MYHNRINILGLVFVLFSLVPLAAQRADFSFQVALPLGTNLSQIAGDPYASFQKWGLSAGIEGIAQVKANKQLSMGMLFQQLGASPTATERKQNEENYIDIRLSYIEVPVLFHWQLMKSDDFYRMDVQLGASFARQLSSRVVQSTTLSGGQNEAYPYLAIVDRQKAFQDFVWTGIGGLGYYFHPNIGLRLRYHHGMSAFFQPTASDSDMEALRHRYVSVALRYVLY